MKLRFFSLTIFFSAVMLIQVGTANASILEGYLSADGIEDTLTDESRAAKTGAAGSFSIGDIIYGVISITSIDTSGVGTDFIPPPTVGAIFSATITGGSGAAATPFVLGPTAQIGAAGFGLDALAPGLFAASGATAAEKAQSIFLLGSSALDLNLVAEAATAKASVIAAASGLSYEATGGLTLGPNKFGDTDFFVATFGTGSTLLENGGFTIFDTSFDGVFTSVTASHPIGPDTLHELSLDGTVRPQTSTSVYAFRDDAFFGVNRVPEPISILVWSGFAVVFVAGTARRRQSA